MNQLNTGYDKNLTYYEHNINLNKFPTIFIHGVGLDNTMWLPQKKFFKNHEVVFYDLYNHGKSKKGYKKLNFYHFIMQLENLINFLNVKKCNLVGFSIGALIAQHFTEKFQNRINKLILIGSVYKRTKEQINIVKKRFQLVSKGKDISDDSIRRWFNSDYLDKNKKVYDFFNSILKKNNIVDFLSAYKVFVEADNHFVNFSKFDLPTLIMTGENEVGSTPKMSEMLNNKIKNSKIFIIPRVKHMATYENSDLVNKKILKFLE